jgi:integrase
VRLNERAVAALKPGQKLHEVWEDHRPGFGVRISPSGLKSFVFLYRFHGRRRRITLGTWPDTSLAEARAARAEAKAAIARGEDPGALRAAAREARRQGVTVDELADVYLERHAQRKKRSWKEDRRQLAKDVRPRWGARKASDIARKDIIGLLNSIVDRGAPIQANRTLACIRKLFAFGVKQALIAASPCVQIDAPAREERRQRVLTEDEIERLWRALEGGVLGRTLGDALKLMLLTGQRVGEVSSLEWSEVDLKRGWWTIPAAKAKNRLAHRVPLTGMARELILARPRPAGARYVFPVFSSTTPDLLQARAVADAVRAKRCGLNNWTPRDLRRTAASHMTGLGVPRLVVSRILNHAERGVTAIYDRHSYDDEKREALELWEQKLQELIGVTTSRALDKPRQSGRRAWASLVS